MSIRTLEKYERWQKSSLCCGETTAIVKKVARSMGGEINGGDIIYNLCAHSTVCTRLAMRFLRWAITEGQASKYHIIKTQICRNLDYRYTCGLFQTVTITWRTNCHYKCIFYFKNEFLLLFFVCLR